VKSLFASFVERLFLLTAPYALTCRILYPAAYPHASILLEFFNTLDATAEQPDAFLKLF